MKKKQRSFKKIEVRKSKIAGVGVYANQLIKKGQRICVFGGRLMTRHQMFRAVDCGDENSADPLLIDKNIYLDLDETSRSFNHSCAPNTYIQGKRVLVAIKDIRPGEEITYDYSTTMTDGKTIQALGHPVWSCTCKCGSKNCTGRIDQFERLPLHRRLYYLKNKYVPSFVLREFVSKPLK